MTPSVFTQPFSVITSAKEVVILPFVCPFVIRITRKTNELRSKFCGDVLCNPFHFGVDPDKWADPGPVLSLSIMCHLALAKVFTH